MAGSGLMTKKAPAVPHLSTGEVADLRADVAAEMAPMAAIAVEEFTNIAAPGAADLEAATATTVAARTVSSFLAGGVAKLLACPRNLTFTTAGVTPADAPATVTITGTDVNGRAQTETLALAQTATIATGLKAFKTVTSVAYAAADGTAATVSIGVGSALGLTKKPKSRAGLMAAIREIAIGAAVTTGTISDTNRTYTPSAAPNGTNDYCVYYEYDASVT
jgi:hypothetical protein